MARDPGTLVVVAPEHPLSLLPPAENPTEELLVQLLYDPLYRLDESLRPVAELAADLPNVSDDGLTWTIPITTEARFHDGLRIRPEDVAFSLRLAASPTCPLGRTLCDAVREHLAEVEAKEDAVVVTLTAPHAPFLAEALGSLPILSEDAVKSATDELIDAAERLGENRPDKVVTRITERVLGDD
jgi:peptide/nickel transport system substrate-binding protein